MTSDDVLIKTKGSIQQLKKELSEVLRKKTTGRKEGYPLTGGQNLEVLEREVECVTHKMKQNGIKPLLVRT